jgi:superoxide dismutase, Fe-Mn family
MSTEFDRRRFMGASGIAVAGVIATTAVRKSFAAAQPASTSGRSPMPYEIKPMPFDPSRIKGMSERLLISHYENNYAGAVKRLNAIDAQLATLDWPAAPNFLINGLKREQLIATNSMILHEHFFNALGGGGRPAGALAAAIDRDFGSFER